MPNLSKIFNQFSFVLSGWSKKLGYPELLLGVILIFVTGVEVHNSVLIYDDLFYPAHLYTLLDTKGYFLTPLYLFFNLDLPSEYRTYGLSRILQGILIILTGGISSKIYAFFISLSQGFSGIAIYILLRRYSVDIVQSLMLAILWICSPFVWMNCFHHYSYILLPYHIAIFLALFASTFANSGLPFQSFGKNGLIALIGGVAIALTGEAHIIVAFAILFIVALSVKSSQLYWWLLLLIVSSFFALIVHFLVWKVIGQNLNLQPRFSANSFDFVTIWNRLIQFNFSLVRGINNQISSIYSRSEGFSGAIVSVLITAGIWLSFWKHSTFTHTDLDKSFVAHFKKIVYVTMYKYRPSYSLFATLFLMLLLSLAVYAITLIMSGAIMNLFPRRYGAVPYTIFAMLAIVTIPLIATDLLGKIFQCVLFAAIIGLFWQLQLQILPIVRSEDKEIAILIKSVAKSGKFDAVIFQNRFDPLFPIQGVDSGTPGLRGGGVLEEIIESPFSSYWTQAFYTRNIIGLQNGGAFQRILGGKIIPISLSFDAESFASASRPIPEARIAVIENNALDQSRLSLKNIDLHENWNDYLRGRFASYIEKVPPPFSYITGGKSFLIDMGNKLIIAQNDQGADKIYGIPMQEESRSNDFVEQYGFVGGLDNVSSISNGGYPNDAYYKTNRNGNFIYRIDFKPELDFVKIKLDFWEMWGRKIGERRFAIDVTWDGKWVELGEIDPAQIAGDRPFSVVLSRETPKTLSIRFRKVAGSIDIPFLQGIRISK